MYWITLTIEQASQVAQGGGEAGQESDEATPERSVSGDPQRHNRALDVDDDLFLNNNIITRRWTIEDGNGREREGGTQKQGGRAKQGEGR